MKLKKRVIAPQNNFEKFFTFILYRYISYVTIILRNKRITLFTFIEPVGKGEIILKRTFFALALLLLFPLGVKAETETSTTAEQSPATTEQAAPANVQSSDSATVESNASGESSTAPSNNSDVKDIEKAKDDTVDQIEKETGVKKSSDPVGNEQDPAKIREMLKDDSMKSILSPSEVDGYTDQQLLNAMTLCQRIGTDTYGLDVGGYARILQALYKDKTLSWSKIENILNYNPSDYKNAIEMVDQIDSLQAYLAAVYPSNSSFMAIRQMSNQELTNVLTYISPIQEKMIAADGDFFPGIIAWISRYSAKDDVRNGAAGTSSTTETTTTSESTTATSTTQSAENKTPASSDNDKKEDKGGFLPKTGEERRTWLTVAGVLILVIIAFVMIRRNRKK